MKWMFLVGKCDPQTLKSSSLNTHQRNYTFSFSFFFFLLWTSNHQTQLSVMRQNKSLARTLHLVLIALRGFSIYILFSLVFLCRRVCTVLSASHAQYAHSTAHGVQATANKRREQRTGAGKGREPSQAKPRGVGFGRERKRGPPPAATATESSSVPN
jgi:hypothetical protein